MDIFEPAEFWVSKNYLLWVVKRRACITACTLILVKDKELKHSLSKYIFIKRWGAVRRVPSWKFTRNCCSWMYALVLDFVDLEEFCDDSWSNQLISFLCILFKQRYICLWFMFMEIKDYCQAMCWATLFEAVILKPGHMGAGFYAVSWGTAGSCLSQKVCLSQELQMVPVIGYRCRLYSCGLAIPIVHL